jgi:thioredoxin-dependent peroxiredoxin
MAPSVTARHGRRPVRDAPLTSAAVLPNDTPAPDFTLPDQDRTPVTLADHRGHWVLLWWYPKASTPG